MVVYGLMIISSVHFVLQFQFFLSLDMEVKIEPGWKSMLEREFRKDYFLRLTDFVRDEYGKNTVYPPDRLFQC